MFRRPLRRVMAVVIFTPLLLALPVKTGPCDGIDILDSGPKLLGSAKADVGYNAINPQPEPPGVWARVLGGLNLPGGWNQLGPQPEPPDLQ